MSNLSDRMAIQDVMLRYALGVDERDYELYRSCFADDAEVVDFTREPVYGADQWLEYVKKALANYRSTQHMMGPTYATIDGNVAQARTNVQALHCPLDVNAPNLILWALYETRMVHDVGIWRIQRHRLVRRESRLEPPTGQ